MAGEGDREMRELELLEVDVAFVVVAAALGGCGSLGSAGVGSCSGEADGEDWKVTGGEATAGTEAAEGAFAVGTKVVGA